MYSLLNICKFIYWYINKIKSCTDYLYLVMNRLPNYLVMSYLCPTFVVLMKGIQIIMHSQIEKVSSKTRRHGGLIETRSVLIRCGFVNKSNYAQPVYDHEQIGKLFGIVIPLSYLCKVIKTYLYE